MQAQPDAVTFLFTDIEGSTRLWEQQPDRMQSALARHDALLRAVVEANHGAVVKMIGDGMHAVFDDPLAALDATLAIQSALAEWDTADGVALRVRCGMHLGVVERRDNDYFGIAVNRAARIMSAAHGGQVLLSQAVVDCVRERLPSPVSLRDLGSVRLKDLATPEHVYQLVHPRLRQEFPGLRSLEATPNNLPRQISSFIGRERELAEIKSLLSGTRLLTLVGVGGIGKTRFALQAAAEVIDSYPDGVWLIELGSIFNPLLVPTSVAQVLGVQERRGTPLTETLCAHLRTRRLLLVLDNCEHLLDACATLTGAILESTAEVTIVATSREPLLIAGEQTYPLQTLSLPEPAANAGAIARSEAVQLFVERARRQLPDFELTAARAATVAELCIHLDGIPLALELAAARIRSMSVEQINARLNERFRLLISGTRMALPRQQTLRATLDWSFDLLTEQERAVLRRVATFAGSFTLEAASSVASDAAIDEFSVTDLLSQLVARSLVVADTNDTSARYRLLETTRIYSLEKLAAAGETGAFRRRHAQYFRDLFDRAPDDWLRRSDAEWRAIYPPELDNVRSALDWALGAEGDAALGIALAGASRAMWSTLGLFREGRERLEATVARMDSQVPESDQARLWLSLGVLLESEAPDQAMATFERAIGMYRRLDDALSLGDALRRRARRLAMMGRIDESASALAESFPAHQASGLPKLLGFYFSDVAFLKLQTGDVASARMHFEKALPLFHAAGAESAELAMLLNLADSTWALGDLDAALADLREAIALTKKRPPFGAKGLLGTCFTNLAGVHTERGELDEALAAAREGLPLRKEAGIAWVAFDHLALRAALAGKLADAARLAGFADSSYKAKETSRQPNEVRAHQRLHALLREELDAGELTHLLSEGARMSEDAACRLAVED